MNTIYCVVFPHTENVHLTKHIGKIPYTWSTLYGMKGVIACYENGPYPNLTKEVPGVEIWPIKKKWKSDFWNQLWFVITHARAIAVLECVHRETGNNIINIVYKILNPRGKFFLKMDVGDDFIARLKKDERNPLKEAVRRMYLWFTDCIGVESKEVYEFTKSYYERVYACRCVRYIPNGYSVTNAIALHEISWKKKENIILSVGRIGTRQKANHLLLEALDSIGEALSSWKIVFVGQVLYEFDTACARYLSKNPWLRDHISFTGSISDRKILGEWYRKAKIFCLTSEWEGFPNVVTEAGYFGDVIVTSDLSSTRDMVDNGRVGRLFPKGESAKLAEMLRSLICSEDTMRTLSEMQREWVVKEFSWETIVTRIHDTLYHNDKG